MPRYSPANARRRREALGAIGGAVKKGTKAVLGGYLKGVDKIAEKIEPYAKKLPKMPSARMRSHRRPK